jgi:hypothetical protein
MSTRSTFLSALVLAASLAPFAASARGGDRAPVQAPSQQQFVAGDTNASQPTAPRGRAAERQIASNQLFLVTEAQYAAINSVPQEN